MATEEIYLPNVILGEKQKMTLLIDFIFSRLPRPYKFACFYIDKWSLKPEIADFIDSNVVNADREYSFAHITKINSRQIEHCTGSEYLTNFISRLLLNDKKKYRD